MKILPPEKYPLYGTFKWGGADLVDGPMGLGGMLPQEFFSDKSMLGHSETLSLIGVILRNY